MAVTPVAPPEHPADIAAGEDKELLRFITCGGVDDGKSTLIGRLLYEPGLVLEDQMAALRADSKRVGTQGDELDFALLLDGLAAEREQGITIDVAYRYFTTARRNFIVADTPGHEQYTRNMVTGASTADCAVLLVDARHGLVTQTRRHSHIVALLGLRHVALAVNKLDLVDFSEERFREIEAEYLEFARGIGLPQVSCVPISALHGDNVVAAQRADAVVRRPAAARVPGERRDRRAPAAARALPASGAVGQPPRRELPRVLRDDRERQRQPR